MNAGIVSMRYAQALLAYAKEQHVEDEIYANMFQLTDAMSKVKEFVIILQNPSLTMHNKVSLLCDAVVNPTPQFRRFAELIIKQGREELLVYICHAYITIYRKEKNIVAVKLTTAIPLTSELSQKIISLVKMQGPSSVELENIVDASIIGGFILEADDVRYDAAIHSALKRIEKQIVDNNRRLI